MLKSDMDFFIKMKDSAIASRDKSRIEAERQTGVINFCEWIISNCEFKDDIKEPQK